MKKIAFVAALAVLGLGVVCANAGVLTDFETGTAEGWAAEALGGATLTPVAGGSAGSNYALRITRPTGEWANTMKILLSAAQWTDIATNTTLSFDYRATAGPGNDVPGWWAEAAPILNSQSGGWDQAPPPLALTLDGNWHTKTWEYPTQALDAGTYREIFFVVQGGATPGGMTVYIDNIQVSSPEVPEPASLGLLAIGGLGLLGRRSRRR